MCAILVIGLILFAGCRTPQPVLKPEKTPEKLVDPPEGAYGSPDYPKEAFDKDEDPGKKAMDAKTNPGAMPTRGGAAPGGNIPGR
jgi:hypothetical protein